MADPNEEQRIAMARQLGREARRGNVDRSLNPGAPGDMAVRAAWYEGWDEEHQIAPASTGGSTWNTGNLPGG